MCIYIYVIVYMYTFNYGQSMWIKKNMYNLYNCSHVFKYLLALCVLYETACNWGRFRKRMGVGKHSTNFRHGNVLWSKIVPIFRPATPTPYPWSPLLSRSKSSGGTLQFPDLEPLHLAALVLIKHGFVGLMMIDVPLHPLPAS